MNIGNVKLHVEDFMEMDTIELYKQEMNWYFLFDDDNNRVVLNGAEAVITHFGFKMFERIGLSPDLNVNFGGWTMDSKSIDDYNSLLLESATRRLDVYGPTGTQETFWEIQRSLYYFINDLYNLYVARLQRYCGTISGFDLFELYLDPKITEARDKLKVSSTKKDIDEAYVAVRNEVTSGRFPTNNFAKLIRNKSLDNKVTDQILVARGDGPDIDSSVFPITITDCFGGGLTKVAYSLMESRLGAMSALYQTDPLKKTEYGNRMFQLNGAYISSAEWGTDCGSQVYQEIYLTENNVNNYLGKMYISPEGKPLFLESHEAYELVGETLKYRSVGDCLNEKSGVICEACYGILARHVPPGTNLGHHVNAIVFKIISQLVLSVKHVLGSASFSIFEPEGMMSTSIMDVNVKALTIKLKRSSEYPITGITIPKWTASRLAELDKVENVTALNNKDLASMRSIVFNFGDDPEDAYALKIANDDTVSHFTYDFLKFMKKENWKIMPSGKVFMSLANWDFDKPVFEIPMRNPNMLDFFQTVKSILTMKEAKKSRRTDDVNNLRIKSVTDCDSFQEAVMLFSNTLMERNIHVNIAMVETIIKAFTYRGPGDWRVGMAGSFNTLGYKDLMSNRSWPGFMALENSHPKLAKAETYLNDKRPAHYMDYFID